MKEAISELEVRGEELKVTSYKLKVRTVSPRRPRGARSLLGGVRGLRAVGGVRGEE